MSESAPKATKRQTAAAWISIVFGLLVCCGGTLSLGGQAMNSSSSMQNMQEEMAYGDPFQVEMQREIREVNDTWVWVIIPLALLRLPLSFALIFTGWMLLSGKPQATMVGLGAFGLAILIECATGGVGMIVGLQTVDVMSDSMEQMMYSMGGGSETEVVLKGMKAGQFLGIAMAFAWTAMKLLFAAVCIFLVLKPGQLELEPPLS